MASELLQTDERLYRSCIFYEAICKTPVEDAYKRMKTVKPNVDYLNFEYWYYRFLGGNLDLDHDRSTDPKTHGLGDLPIELVENIVRDLGLVDKLSARRVCRKLRAVSDNQPSKFQNVSMSITEKSCEIQFEQLKIEYSAEENGNYLLKTPRKTISLKGDYSKMAMEEFMLVINNPNWSFEQLELGFPSGYGHRDYHDSTIHRLISMLTDCPIRVKQLRITAKKMSLVIGLIPKFDADTLESIDLEYEKIDKESSEKLFEMDQWKNAKKLKLSETPYWFPIEKLFHCKEFTVVNEIDMSKNNFQKIANILFQSPTFESCSLLIENGYLEYDEEIFFDEIDGYFGARTHYNRRHYPIENSNDYFEVTYQERNWPERYPPIYLGIRRVRV